MSEKVIVQINYLGPFIKEIDEFKKSPWLKEMSLPLLASFLDLPEEKIDSEIMGRYIEVTNEETHMPITPHSERLFNRLLYPLRLAKKYFCFQEYISSIALCGMVGEMLAMIIWQMSHVQVKGYNITEQQERLILGRSFEKAGQERRVDILKGFGFIDDKAEKRLTFLRETRRPYLHFWNLTKNSDEIKNDARNCVLNALGLFKQVFDIRLADAGTIHLNPMALRFVKENT